METITEETYIKAFHFVNRQRVIPSPSETGPLPKTKKVLEWHCTSLLKLIFDMQNEDKDLIEVTEIQFFINIIPKELPEHIYDTIKEEIITLLHNIN